VCETPPYVSSDFERRKRSIGQNIVINYDDYQALSTIYYIDNPIFDQLPPIEYDKESTILSKGNQSAFVVYMMEKRELFVNFFIATIQNESLSSDSQQFNKYQQN
jgi:hypothetical protein